MAVRRVGTPEQRKSAIDHAYDMFPRLAERRGQRAGTLSGGEQQMLALALGLAGPSKLLKQGSVAWTGPAENAAQEVLDRYLGESADAMA